MKLTAERPLERLAHRTERPDAAVFCTFTFDAVFFEEHVLRTVLQLASDPEEHPARYHEEARRVLQEVPVACVVDADMRGGGHRLPYDLLDVGTRVFHPKLVVVVYADFARVSVGSGNLTRGGYGDNAETFVVRDFAYEVPEEAATLRETAAFLRGVLGLVRHRGSQLEAALSILEPRLARSRAPKERTIAFLHSLTEPLLDQIQALVPPDAVVERVGVLAPFFERDDRSASAESEWDSVLGALARTTAKARPRIDLAILWDDPPLSAHTCKHPPHLEDGMGRLWAWSNDEGDEPSVAYRRLTNVMSRQVEMTDARGAPRRVPRPEAEEALASRKLGVIEKVSAYAPAGVVERLEASADLSLWLHPAWRHVDHRARRRPLHAKLYVLEVREKRTTSTLLVVGSPNPSHGALRRSVREGGNVECAFVFTIDEAVRLADLCPELVPCPRSLVTLLERDYPTAEPNYGAWIESAVHDAEEGSLRLTWADSGPRPLPPWSVHYCGKTLASGIDVPREEVVIVPFVLAPASCEIELVVETNAGERRFPIPITVADITLLPVSAHLADLSLRELLAVLGKRVGVERLGTLRAQRGSSGMGSVLEALFGEGFGPTDVFRAYWAVAKDLEDEHLSAQAFRARLVGGLSLKTIWSRMKDATDAPPASGAGSMLSSDEAWFYGAELLRTLERVEIPKGSETKQKQAFLDELCRAVRADLERLMPNVARAPWLKAVIDHYRCGDTPAALGDPSIGILPVGAADVTDAPPAAAEPTETI